MPVSSDRSPPGGRATTAAGGGPGWVRAVFGGIDVVIAFLGTWTLLCWAVVLLGGSFATLLRLAWVPGVAAALWWWRARGDGGAVAVADEAPAVGEAGRGLAVGALVLAAYLASGSYLLFWGLAVGALLLAARRGAAAPGGAAPGGGASESPLALLAVCAAAVAVTLAAHRPDPDDSFYLNIVVTALDHPDRPLLGFDGLHGEAGRPLFETWYRLKSYEPLVAVLARLAGPAPETLYYLVLPALFALLAVLLHWALLRRLGGGFAALGAAVVVAVLIAWGDGHQAFGNFAFVRLFQGKAVTVMVSVPAALWYALRFAGAPSARGWLLLSLAQVAAVGISGSAVVAAPLAAATMLAGGFAASRRVAPRGALLLGLAASAVVGSFALGMLVVMPREHALGLSLAEWWALPAASERGLQTVLGAGPRGWLALLVLLVAPWLAPRASRRVLVAYGAAVLLLALNPFLAAWVGRIAARLTWRVVWAVPFPLLIGLCGQRLAALAAARAGGRPAAWGAAAALAGIFAALPGQWTVAASNGTRLGWPAEHALAAAVAHLAGPQGLLLAPYALAMWVPTVRGHPRLIGVRPTYFTPFAADEALARKRLVTAVSRGDPAPAAVVAELRRRAVDVVVRRAGRRTESMATALAAAGCRPRGDAALGLAPGTLGRSGYEVWVCRWSAALPSTGAGGDARPAP